MIAPCRVEIRADGHFVYAHLAMSDGSESVELGRVNRRMLEDIPELFDKWKELCTAAMAHVVSTATGAQVTEVIEKQVPPQDPERN